MRPRRFRARFELGTVPEFGDIAKINDYRERRAQAFVRGRGGVRKPLRAAGVTN